MSRDEFYRVPLSTAEAQATLAALRALARAARQDPALPGDIEVSVLESAADRVEAELPDFAVARAGLLARDLHAGLAHVGAASSNLSPDDDDSVGEREKPPFPTGRARRLLRDAWDRDVPVEIEYFVARRNEWTSRRVDIENIYQDGGVWYMAGHCGLRDDYRNFRLDHVRSVRLLEEGDEAEDVPDPFAER